MRPPQRLDFRVPARHRFPQALGSGSFLKNALPELCRPAGLAVTTLPGGIEPPGRVIPALAQDLQAATLAGHRLLNLSKTQPGIRELPEGLHEPGPAGLLRLPLLGHGSLALGAVRLLRFQTQGGGVGLRGEALDSVPFLEHICFKAEDPDRVGLDVAAGALNPGGIVGGSP